MIRIFEKYFFADLSTYFPALPEVKFNIYLLFLSVGICLACFAVYFQKRAAYRLVKGLLRAKAVSPETAKSLLSLDLAGNRLLLRQLAANGYIYRAVSRTDIAERQEDTPVNEEKTTAPQDAVLKAKYYIPSEKRAAAERVYDTDGGGISRPFILSLAVLLVYFALMFIIPSLLSLLSGM